ncbi:hypothetical protein EVAR_94819_1 [Eumeta japonica]|uniref:Uncharacterized protein n=1 Tax=Eumeta variegata TaxID=151549 RepID=A0A4C1UI30_EUMVA|nr:hypothetical protein EVAR_94819_1 [Eumeta japonica]
MSEHIDYTKKKPSGSEYRKRKAEKEKEFKRTKKFMNIDKYIKTKNEDLNMPSTSEIQMNVLVEEPLSDESNQMIEYCVEEIVDKDSQSEVTNRDIITNAVHDNSIRDVQQIQILDDVSTAVPNISDPAIWPVTQNSKIIDHIITSGLVQTYVGQQSLVRLQTAFGDEAPSKTSIYYWFAVFKCGRVNLVTNSVIVVVCPTL